MIILPEPLEFEWDKGNSDKNFKKHKLSNREVEQVFINNKEKFTFEDKKHSAIEKRYGIFGKMDNGKLLSIVFTLITKPRIISPALSRGARTEKTSLAKESFALSLINLKLLIILFSTESPYRELILVLIEACIVPFETIIVLLLL